MKISCIIPVYNTEQYLRKCVKSVLKQTYKDVEIVLVNDCSTDRSADICRDFERNYPDKVKFIDKKVNEGVDKARFSGLDYVLQSNPDGAVFFLDSDDWILSVTFQIMSDEMAMENVDVVQIQMKLCYKTFSRNRKVPAECRVYRGKELDPLYLTYFGSGALGMELCGKLIKTKIIKRANLSPSGFTHGEDLMFNLNLFPHYTSYSLLDYYGYCYRYGGVTSKFSIKLWENIKAQYKVKRDLAEGKNIPGALRLCTMELRNVLYAMTELRISMLKEPKEMTIDWLKSELSIPDLWTEVDQYAKSEGQHRDKAVAEKDFEGIYLDSLRAVKAMRMHDFIKNIIKPLL